MKRETSYEIWMSEEGIPIIEGYGIEDVTELPRKSWARTGGLGAYIQLKGQEGFTGMYVGEIPPVNTAISSEMADRLKRRRKEYGF